MKLKDEHKFGLLMGAGFVLFLGVAYLAGRRPRMKSVYDHDETIDVVQGHPFIVRFPRGEYSSASPDLVITAQNDVGTESQVVMVAPMISPTKEEYTIKTVLVEEDTGKPFPVEIIARPASAYGTVPTEALPA